MSLLPSVFVSYARTDSHSIQYAVGLLEAGGAEVFRDIDDIGFGERWEEVIAERINDCERVLVFWSKAAQQSEWVGREYRMALKLEKKLVPVMLDNTPLPPDLGAFHALTLAHFMPKTSRVKRYGGWVVGGVATAALAGVLISQSLENFTAETVSTESMAEAPADGLAETAPVADVSEVEAAGADAVQTFEQSAEILVEAQAVEQSVDALSAEQPMRPPPPAAVMRPNQNPGTTPNYPPQSQRESTAAVAVNEAPLIPAPAAPVPESIVVEPSASVEISTASDVTTDDGSTEGSAAPAVEGMQIAQLLPWIVGILALLALCWLALRRFSRRDAEAAAGERFVEMVFDEHTAAGP